MWLLIIFVLWPIIEIALFVVIGGEIGVAATILWVILTAFLGMWAMRLQGAAAMIDLQRAIDDFRAPARPLAHGALAMIGGALLVLPGFFTDALGILLLIPPVRSGLLALLGRRARVSATAGSRVHPGWPPDQPHRPPVIDAEFVVVEEVDEDIPPSGNDSDHPDYDHPDAGPSPRPGSGRGQRPPSGWTRH